MIHSRGTRMCPLSIMKTLIAVITFIPVLLISIFLEVRSFVVTIYKELKEVIDERL